MAKLRRAAIAAALIAGAAAGVAYGDSTGLVPLSSTRSVVLPPCGGEVVQGMTCTLDDEFDGTALNTALWTAQTTAASQYTTGASPARACYVAPDVSVSGGLLNLTARRETAAFTCMHGKTPFVTAYDAGMVTTVGKWSQTYGRFEVKALIPATAIKGLQETLWLWPVNQFKYGPWPGSGEIDFSEFYSQYANLDVPYLHYALNSYQPVTAYNCRISQGQFNTYALTWTPGRLAITVNGSPCLTDNYRAANAASPAPFNQPFFLAFTQALGVHTNATADTTPLPATTQVDYVRVWK